MPDPCPNGRAGLERWSREDSRETASRAADSARRGRAPDANRGSGGIALACPAAAASAGLV